MNIIIINIIQQCLSMLLELVDSKAFRDREETFGARRIIFQEQIQGLVLSIDKTQGH